MRKSFMLIALLSLNACYYTAPVSEPYADDIYIIEQASYGVLPLYEDGYETTNIMTYNQPATTSSVMYIEQSVPESVYSYQEPTIVYNENPLLPPPQIYHHVGTTPRKHIAYPIPKLNKVKTQRQKKPKKPEVIYRSSQAEGRP